MGETGEGESANNEVPKVIRDAEAAAKRAVEKAASEAGIPKDKLPPWHVGLPLPLMLALFYLAFGKVVFDTVNMPQPTPVKQEAQMPTQEVNKTSYKVTALSGSEIPDKTWTSNSIHVVNNIVKTTVPDIKMNPLYFDRYLSGGRMPITIGTKEVVNNTGILYIVTDKNLDPNNPPDYELHFYDMKSRGTELAVKQESIEVTTLGDLAGNPEDLEPGSENLAVVKITGLGSWLDRIFGNGVEIRLEDKQPEYSVQLPGQAQELMPNPRSSVVVYTVRPVPTPGR